MADRNYVLVVRSEMTNSVRGLYVSISEDGREVLVRQDGRYNEGSASDFNGLAVNLYNVTTTARSTYSVGAVWDELAGDGHTFRVPNDEEIHLDVGVLRVGPSVVRGTAVPSGRNAPVTLQGRDIAGSAEIAEDGWLRPYGNQVNDWDFEFRPLERPTEVVHRYTDLEAVKLILRANPTREAGFDANFTDRLNACIASAERRIEGFCGRRFTASAAATRSYRVNSPVVIDCDDIDLTQPVAVSTGDNGQVAVTRWRVPRTFAAYNVGRYVEPDRRYWKPMLGTDIMVTAHFGWPEIPPEVVDYAGRYAAAIFDSDAATAGLIGIGDGMAYGRTPGKDMKTQLGHLRRVPVG